MVERAEDFREDLEKSVGSEYNVTATDWNRNLLVTKGDEKILVLYRSMWYDGEFVVQPKRNEHTAFTQKVADDLGIRFVEC
jgi:hypothetical protein